ncbi:hypothetical protein V8C86DRAFT_2497112 [Haematococcus lacustris]
MRAAGIRTCCTADMAEGERLIPGPAGLLQALRARNEPDDAVSALLADLQAPRGGGSWRQLGTQQNTNFQCASWELALNCLDIVEWDPTHPLLKNNVASIQRDPTTCKVPNLLAVICSLVHSAAGDAMVVLRDPSGEVKAAVSLKVLQQHPAFCPGATVALKQVTFICPMPSIQYLCIVPENVTQVWPAPVSNATQGPGLHATGQIMAGRGARVPGLDSRSLALLPPSAATHGNHAKGTGCVRHTPNTQRHADEQGGPGVVNIMQTGTQPQHIQHRHQGQGHGRPGTAAAGDAASPQNAHTSIANTQQPGSNHTAQKGPHVQQTQGLAAAAQQPGLAGTYGQQQRMEQGPSTGSGAQAPGLLGLFGLFSHRPAQPAPVQPLEQPRPWAGVPAMRLPQRPSVSAARSFAGGDEDEDDVFLEDDGEGDDGGEIELGQFDILGVLPAKPGPSAQAPDPAPPQPLVTASPATCTATTALPVNTTACSSNPLAVPTHVRPGTAGTPQHPGPARAQPASPAIDPPPPRPVRPLPGRQQAPGAMPPQAGLDTAGHATAGAPPVKRQRAASGTSGAPAAAAVSGLGVAPVATKTPVAKPVLKPLLKPDTVRSLQLMRQQAQQQREAAQGLGLSPGQGVAQGHGTELQGQRTPWDVAGKAAVMGGQLRPSIRLLGDEEDDGPELADLDFS